MIAPFGWVLASAVSVCMVTGVDDLQVGAAVKSVREARGMTQAELADAASRAGWASAYPQTILKVEKGTRSLKLTEADAIARALGVPVTTLLAARALTQLNEVAAAYQQHLALLKEVEHVRNRKAMADADEKRLLKQLKVSSRAGLSLVDATRKWLEQTPDLTDSERQGVSTSLTGWENQLAKTDPNSFPMKTRSESGRDLPLAGTLGVTDGGHIAVQVDIDEAAQRDWDDKVQPLLLRRGKGSDDAERQSIDAQVKVALSEWARKHPDAAKSFLGGVEHSKTVGLRFDPAEHTAGATHE